MVKAMHKCPVCFYPAMDSPPLDYMICPCCGTEFGLDDSEMTHDDLRILWVLKQCAWFSTFTNPPINWNPITQLGLLQWRTAPLTGAGVVQQPLIKYVA
jgi:hypothetical protein